ncbi:MAG TPA: GNAT family N-acetyltransferase [Bacteroidales bacterium]|jgi:dTDP-4-amino-4,6-dideoxy-D-galactose acyltransferase|nr:GNAT family N-acetyltransferase [Bacteroidales bacterium]
MKNKYRFLEYDSNKFGYKVAELININSKQELKDSLLELKENNYKLCYFMFNTDEDEKKLWANELNGWFADVKVTLSKALNTENITDIKDIQKYKYNEINDDLLSLAYQSGFESRFKKDPKFSNNEFKKLYYDWIKKSVTCEIADYVLVKYQNDEIIGFITVKFEQPFATIGLIAVNKSYRSQGIGKKLLKKAEFIAYQNNCEKINVSTQEINTNAINFYLRNQYSVIFRKNIYHFWF